MEVKKTRTLCNGAVSSRVRANLIPTVEIYQSQETSRSIAAAIGQSSDLFLECLGHSSCVKTSRLYSDSIQSVKMSRRIAYVIIGGLAKLNPRK